jgi:hypothetical protein
MKQQTLAMAVDEGGGFESRRKRTRRDEFLETMNAIMPWAQLCAVIEPHYPKRGIGRPPIGLERMLRIHFVQHWFNQRTRRAGAVAELARSKNRNKSKIRARVEHVFAVSRIVARIFGRSSIAPKSI